MGMKCDHKRCRVCGRLYETGRDGICRPCQRAKGSTRARSNSPPHKRHKHLRCDCGKPAVTVVDVRVGEDGVYQVRLPLCADCLQIEQSYGLAYAALNPDAGSTS
jgi:hypothetical protein